jgi:deoxyribodipyrimidine photolyase-related protein
MKSLILFPHQLFERNLLPKEIERIYLIEEALFFTQFRFHKQKLILHRASMQHYAKQMKEDGLIIETVSFNEAYPKCDEVIAFEVHDDFLNRKIKAHYPSIEWIKNPSFLEGATLKKMKHYRMSSFYIEQRKKLEILVEENKKPIGGKWSFDSENRKSLPKDISLPELPKIHTKEEVESIKQATRYIENHFENNYGTADPFWIPISHKSARKCLSHFLKNNLGNFGTYEDAIHSKETFLFHSLLSPLINIGLLTPQEVIEEALTFAGKHEVPLNSLEGFIRQIIGWREFVNQIYHLEGPRQRTRNFFKHKRSIPESFWKGTTGITPIDDSIQKVLTYGYAHHIERLMVLSNFMNLCEFDPNEIYEWFMSLFVDAYDWVMVPNVYGMSLYADGGLMTTKPYISSSNYILKMSNYKKGEWCSVWDGLYWRFIEKHQSFFENNPRLSVMTIALKRMKPEKRKAHKAAAENFLEKLSL